MKPMNNSISKLFLVVGLLSLLPIETVNAQFQMTRLPKRIEEVLENPNLGEVLRSKTQTDSVAPRVAAIPADLAPTSPSPIYSNVPSRFSAPSPSANTSQTRLAKLPSVADLETETPPPIIRKPASIPVDDVVPQTPTPVIRSELTRPEKATETPDLSVNSELQKPLVPVKGQLRFRVTGVSTLVESQPADLLIEVLNPTGHPIGPVAVNIKVPEEITITRFDHDAWLDAERRIIAFQLDRVEPGAIEKIGMQGISHSIGKTSVEVALLSGETMLAHRDIATQILPQQIARQQSFSSNDASDSDTIRK